MAETNGISLIIPSARKVPHGNHKRISGAFSPLELMDCPHQSVGVCFNNELGDTSMKCLAYLLVLVAASGVGCAYTVTQGPNSVSKDGKPDAVVKTKGNYSVAAHCFSRAYRNGGCQTARGQLYCYIMPQVEVAPDKDFGEFYKGNEFNVIFRNTADGNSEGEVYIHSDPLRSSSGKRTDLNFLLDRTERCQIKDSPSDEQKDDDTTSESSS